MKHLEALLVDETGSTYVDYVVLCVAVAVIIGGYYNVFNGNRLLRSSTTGVIEQLAHGVGHDFIGEGPPVHERPSTATPRTSNPRFKRILTGDSRWTAAGSGVRSLLGADRSVTILDTLTNQRMTIRPGLRANMIDDSAGRWIFAGPGSLGAITFDPSSGDAYMIDPVSGMRNQLDLLSLQHMALIEIALDDVAAPLIVLVQPSLGIASILLG